MKKFNIGDRVTYIPFGKGASPDSTQHGIVKELREDGIFVVYNCNGDWKHYNDYTAEWTAIYCLSKGWK